MNCLPRHLLKKLNTQNKKGLPEQTLLCVCEFYIRKQRSPFAAFQNNIV